MIAKEFPDTNLKPTRWAAITPREQVTQVFDDALTIVGTQRCLPSPTPGRPPNAPRKTAFVGFPGESDESHRATGVAGVSTFLRFQLLDPRLEQRNSLQEGDRRVRGGLRVLVRAACALRPVARETARHVAKLVKGEGGFHLHTPTANARPAVAAKVALPSAIISSSCCASSPSE